MGKAKKDKRQSGTSIGDLLVELRKERGLLQKDAAPKLGLTVSTLSSYERENSSPDYDTLIRICDFYNVSADYLLGRIRCRRPFSLQTAQIEDFTSRECMDYLRRINQMEAQLHRRLDILLGKRNG